MNICGVLSLRNTSSFGNDNLLLLLHKLHYDTLSGIYTICYWIVDVSINIRIRNLITENVALNKPAGQQYTYGNIPQLGAERAVDGQKSDLSSSGGQCAISGGGQSTADWWVDLGKVLSIHHVFIQYMTGNMMWGMVFKTYINTLDINSINDTMHLNNSIKRFFFKFLVCTLKCQN